MIYDLASVVLGPALSAGAAAQAVVSEPEVDTRAMMQTFAEHDYALETAARQPSLIDAARRQWAESTEALANGANPFPSSINVRPHDPLASEPAIGAVFSSQPVAIDLIWVQSGGDQEFVSFVVAPDGFSQPIWTISHEDERAPDEGLSRAYTHIGGCAENRDLADVVENDPVLITASCELRPGWTLAYSLNGPKT